MALELHFGRMIAKTAPSDVEVNRAKMHATTIRTRLLKSFSLKGFRFIGSHSRETAIRAHSDLDLLAIFARDEARWGDRLKSSYTFINAIRNDLAERYPHTDVGRDGQAVVVNFGGDQSVDVVPGIFWGPGPNNYPIYLIPDGSGDWLQTGPDRHSKYLTDENEKSTGKLKRVIRLIKYWRECRSPRIPLSSFHLELLLASEGVCVGVKSYPVCLFDAFYLIANRQGRGLRDPLGIAGIVQATGSDSQRNQIANAAEYARDHAWSAILATQKKDIHEAIRQWNIVFNGEFPSFR